MSRLPHCWGTTVFCSPPLLWGSAFTIATRGGSQEVSSNQLLVISLILWGCWWGFIADRSLHSAEFQTTWTTHCGFYCFSHSFLWIFQPEQWTKGGMKRTYWLLFLTLPYSFSADWRWTNFYRHIHSMCRRNFRLTVSVGDQILFSQNTSFWKQQKYNKLHFSDYVGWTLV